MEENNCYFGIDKKEKYILDFDKNYIKEFVTKEELKEWGNLLQNSSMKNVKTKKSKFRKESFISTPLIKDEFKEIIKSFKKQSIITKGSCLRKFGELELFRCQKHKNENKWKMGFKKWGDYYILELYGNEEIEKLESDNWERYESFKEFLTGISEKNNVINYFGICSREFYKDCFVYYSAEIDGWKKRGNEAIEMKLQNMNTYQRLNYDRTFCTALQSALTNIETIIYGFHGNNELQELEEYTIDQLKYQVKFQSSGNCYDVDKGLLVIDMILQHLIEKFHQISSEFKRENFTLIIDFDGEKCAEKLKSNESMLFTDYLSYKTEN